jgi:hypothetical protein
MSPCSSESEDCASLESALVIPPRRIVRRPVRLNESSLRVRKGDNHPLEGGFILWEGTMKRFVSVVIALATGLPAASAFAAPIEASAVVTSRPDGANFDYSITLTNSSASTSPIGTFWFAWEPGADFLPSNPFNITTPTGWTEQVTHTGPGDGFAIQFVGGTGALLTPGNSLSGFGFTSAETPTQLAANSPFFPGTLATTSFAYAGEPFVQPQEQFVVQVSSIPEPSTLVFGIVVVVSSAGYVQFKKRKGIA